MAIYHCSAKTISRSKGSSVVNSAAYRSGEKLYDERAEKTFFYAGKIVDVMHKEIMAPENAPEWAGDREKLWNAVELGEKRRDAQLAREVEISLPREFTTDQNIALVKEYVRREFVDRGMIADVCMHYGKKGDSYNPHAHVLLTMREVSEEGFGKKVVSWNKKELLQEWRESWANLTNKHLSLNGFDLKVDNRTLEAQGIDLEPQNVKLPVDAKERLTEQKERQLEIMRENGERLSQNPEIALHAITLQQATFTDRDIAKYLHSRTVDREQFQTVFDKIKGHEELVQLSSAGYGVGKDSREARYTTKEMLDIERKLFRDVHAKAREGNFEVKADRVQQKLHEAEENDRGLKERGDLSSEQRAAIEYICQNKDFRAIVGYAGTGKTHMLAKAKEIWEEAGYRVKGAALSGIAAQGLEKGAGIESRTVARRLIDWENGRDQLGKKDILVIDEAGMLGTRDVARIIAEARERGTKVVMLGDPQQLQAIEAGAAFRGIVEREGCLKMSDVKRQEVGWQREATKMLAIGEVKKALDMYRTQGHIKYCFTEEGRSVDKMVEAWALDRDKNIDGDRNRGENRNDREGETRQAREGIEKGAKAGIKEGDAKETQIMLAHRKKDVAELNKKAREVLKETGELGSGVRFNTVNGTKEFSLGDQVYFLRNDSGLSVKNGTLGVISSIDKGGNVTVSVKEPAGERSVSFNIENYKHLDYGYASTIHKVQGITVDRVYVLASKGFNQNLTYVALSRHTKSVDMFWSRDDFRSFDHLKWHLSKEVKRDNALDYIKTAQEFGEARGVRSVYEDIKVKFLEGYKEVKGKVHDGFLDGVREARDAVARSQIMQSLEERRQYNRGIKAFEKENKGKVLGGRMGYGDNFKFHGMQKLGDKEYGFLQISKDRYRIFPGERCHDLKIGDSGHMKPSREGLVAAPSKETLYNRQIAEVQAKEAKWNRQVSNLQEEYGKKVTMDIADGDTGKFRDTFKFDRKEYIVMESYDKVAIIDREIFRGSMRTGDYMKIERDHEKAHMSEIFGSRSSSKGQEQFVAMRDDQKHKKMEKAQQKERVLEKTRSKEMEMDFGM